MHKIKTMNVIITVKEYGVDKPLYQHEFRLGYNNLPRKGDVIRYGDNQDSLVSIISWDYENEIINVICSK